MRKARIHLTIDVPLADDWAYPPETVTDEQRAHLEYLMLLDDPAEYIEYAVKRGPGWVVSSKYRFVEEQMPGRQ